MWILTVLAGVAVLVIALIVVVMNSGNKGGRHAQAGNSQANKQVDNPKARGNMRSDSGLD